MKKMLLALVLVLGAAAGAHGQAPFKIHTSPKLPARDALERMKLTLAWNTRVRVDGNRDGIASLQLIPGANAQIVVQTFKGAVYLYGADTGDLVWKTQVGVPYWTSQPAAFNSQSIFVTRRSILHVLNRLDGSQRVYTYDPALKQAAFGYELGFAPNAAPTADEEFLYLPMGNRVQAIYVPDFERFEQLRRAREEFIKGKLKRDPLIGANLSGGEEAMLISQNSPQPDFYWAYGLGNQITTSPVLFNRENLSILTTDGTLTILNRFERKRTTDPIEFKMAGSTLAAAGQHEHVAYVGSDDFNLYAINMKSKGLDWRYIAGAPIMRQPRVNDRDVFIATDRLGMRRVDRLSGRAVWTNTDATRFLAANHQFVYAMDHVGKFFVLDNRRGATLAKIDLSDWKILLPNEWTDRIYLAANDGQVMCLRHRELTKPLIMKTVDDIRPKEEKMPKEEKKEEKKDEEKKDANAAAKGAKLGRLAAAAPRIEAAPAREAILESAQNVRRPRAGR